MLFYLLIPVIVFSLIVYAFNSSRFSSPPHDREFRVYLDDACKIFNESYPGINTRYESRDGKFYVHCNKSFAYDNRNNTKLLEEVDDIISYVFETYKGISVEIIYD